MVNDCGDSGGGNGGVDGMSQGSGLQRRHTVAMGVYLQMVRCATMRCVECGASALSCSASTYLLAVLVAEGGCRIDVFVATFASADDNATAKRKSFQHEFQRFLEPKDLSAFLVELIVDDLLECLLTRHGIQF